MQGGAALSERQQLEQAITALENQRTTLGDAVVDASIAALRERLTALERAEAPAQELRGERKLVTTMFADVSGFTALTETMDPEAVRELMNGCFEHLVPIIRKYGGTVDKFTGDGVMVLFGAPVAHENDPERALRAALEMTDVLPHFNAQCALDLGLHFGINTGLVIAGGIGTSDRQEYSVMGDAVNLARRLEEVSRRDEILVGPDTYRLTEPLFEFEPLQPIELKGKTEPVPVYRLLAHKAVAGAKVRGIAGLESPLVGRETEFRALRETLQQLQAGVGGVVTIVGEAGLGKSRLVAELRREVSAIDLRWIEGRCLSYGTSVAYLLWLEMLRGLLGVTAEDAPATAQAALSNEVESRCPDSGQRIYPYLAQLMSLSLAPEHEALLRSIAGEALKSNTFRAVETMIECAAREHPLVLVCEDLHWADPTSLELLEQLLALMDRAPVLLVCAFRPHAGHACWHVRETAARLYRHRHTDLWLDPLSADESKTLVGNFLHVEVSSAELRERILDHAEGNPFYVEEIIRSLIDSGAIAHDGTTGRWHMTQEVEDIAIPDTLQGVLTARIDRLEEGTKRVLQVASVTGRIFPYRLLAAVVKEERELDARLSTLQQEEMVRERARVPELEYIFKHHLTQEAAYNGLLRRERRRFHRRVAEALERLFPDRLEEQLGLLAHHWEQAGERKRAIGYLRRAGKQAAAQFAHTEAVSYLTRALNLTLDTEPAQHYALLLARERIHDLQGAPQARLQDLTDLETLAESLDDDRRRAEVALRRSNYAETAGDYPTAIAAAKLAIGVARTAQDTSSEAAGYLQWAAAAQRQGDYHLARSLLKQTLTLINARSSVGPEERSRDVEVEALRTFGNILAEQGDFGGARAYYEQVLHIAQDAADRRGESLAFHNLGVVCEYVGDYATAKAYYEQALLLTQEMADRRGEGESLVSLSLLAHHMDDHEVACAYVQKALPILQALDDRHFVAYALTFLGHALSDLDRPAEAATAYQQALASRRELGQAYLAMEPLAGLARVALAQGDLLQARACADEILNYLESSSLDGTEEPLRIYLTCYRVLSTTQDPRAQDILVTAHDLLQEQAARIHDGRMRRSFLESVAAHREILDEFALYRTIRRHTSRRESS